MMIIPYMPRFAKIIVYKKLPRNFEYFDYKIPSFLDGKLEIGHVVNIPFKKSVIQGVVAEFADSSEFKYIKEISGINEKVERLTLNQVKLMTWFSAYYYQSLGSTLRLILPQIPKNKIQLKAQEVSEQNDSSNENNKAINKLSEHILCSAEKKFLLFPYQLSEKNELYTQLCSEIVAKNKQILIIFPQKNKLDEFKLQLNKEVLKQTVEITSDLHTKKTEYLNAWQLIQQKKVNIVLGTRSAVFMPFDNYELIIIDDAHSEDHKSWDQNPRYSTITVAKKIQQLINCKLILSSLTPKIEDTYIAKKENYKLINLTKNDCKVELFDLNKESQTGFTYLGSDVLTKIDKASGKVMVIVNKKGMYSYLFCEECNYEAKCQTCDLPLVVTEDKKLKCFHCNKEYTSEVKCPKCSSIKMKSLGIGIEQIEQDLTKRFPQKQLVFSTGQNLTKKDFMNIELLSFVYVDSLVHLADFNSNYRLNAYLWELMQKAKFYNEKCEIVLQTFFPDNNVFINLNKSFGDFYQKELELRENHNYPPFARLIKLFYQHHDLAICKKEAEDLYKQLSNVNNEIQLKITEPYLYYTKKVRSRYRYQIGVFLPNDVKLEKENELLGIVPEHWTIDKDPLDML